MNVAKSTAERCRACNDIAQVKLVDHCLKRPSTGFGPVEPKPSAAQFRPLRRTRDSASSLTAQIVGAAPGQDVADRQHRGHHRVILVVVAVHAVAADEVQRRDSSPRARRGSLRHWRRRLVIDRIGLLLAHDARRRRLARIAQPELCHLASWRARPDRRRSTTTGRRLRSRNIRGRRRRGSVRHHFGRPASEILHPADLHLGSWM